MAMGRPTLYSEEMVEKALEYLVTYKEQGDVVPQIAGLAIHLKVSRDTVYDWAKQEDKADFSYIVAEVLSAQERGLVNGGLNQDFNASMSKLMLAKHGYSEKQEIDVKDTTPTPEKRKSRIEALLNKCKS